MLRSTLIVGLLVVTPTLAQAQAQKTPDIEVFGGLSYLNVAGYYEREHFANLATGVTFNVNKHFGLAADAGLPFAGPSQTFQSLVVGLPFRRPPFVELGRQTTRTTTALFGPRFFLRRERITLSAHGLAGVVRTRNSSEFSNVSVFGRPLGTSSFSYSENTFAYAGGGGVDLNINSRFAIRVMQADYIRARIEKTGNQVRLQSGVVVRFGRGSH